jgi:hypothetical protein
LIEIAAPEKIQIGGFWYKIVCSPEEDAYLKEHGWWGRYSEAEQLCSVRSDANPQLMSATLIEEIFHAIEVVYLGRQLDHVDLKNLAAGWFQVMEEMGVRLAAARSTKCEYRNPKQIRSTKF